ncbi:protein EGG APPARATUS-1 [Zea mays]|uniref:protein EGG APPARATUS-1 n=1 Tax=Zea mays TaxID=4577 RepID=UPI001D0FC666|nr:protein EGG APPARATUS-1 [Zea mays]
MSTCPAIVIRQHEGRRGHRRYGSGGGVCRHGRLRHLFPVARGGPRFGGDDDEGARRRRLGHLPRGVRGQPAVVFYHPPHGRRGSCRCHVRCLFDR